MSAEEIYEALQEATIANQKIKDIIFKLKDSNEDLRKRNSELLSCQFDNAEEVYYKGYKLSDLISLAEICRECGIYPNDLTDNMENIRKIYQCAQDQAWEIFKKTMLKSFK